MARPKKYTNKSQYRDKHKEEYTNISISKEVLEKLKILKEEYKRLNKAKIVGYDKVLRQLLSLSLDKN